MSFSDQLKSQLNIIDVVGQYVRLKRLGATGRYLGLCPFHTEKTPSFNVNSSLQFYKCFGCGVGGDVYKFVMEIEGLTFPETLKSLADRAGIPMPERHAADTPEDRRREIILEMHEVAAELFQTNLRSPLGTEARRYLESRGVSRAAMDEFRLGLSDSSGQQLTQRLQRYNEAALAESGLISRRQDGSGFFDRFRGRLMFPIHSEAGKVIAFGGRALRSDDEPKYLNSPETAAKLYKKSQVLYNLHRAKVDARKYGRMILVEGYLDVIAVYSSGLREVVASCGTALGSDQVRAIKRQVSFGKAVAGEIVRSFDSDDAGEIATDKSFGIMAAEGLRIKLVTLPDGLDPDEYIQKYGAASYRAKVDNAEGYFLARAKVASRKFDTGTAEGRMDALQSMWPDFQQVVDPLERHAIVNEIAEFLRVDRDSAREWVRRKLIGNAPNRQVSSASLPLRPSEKILLTCLLISEEARSAINHYLKHTTLRDTLDVPSVFDAVLALEEEGTPFSFEVLCNKLEPRVQRLLMELGFGEQGIRDDQALGQALGCLSALEVASQKIEERKLKRQIMELEKSGRLQEALQLTDKLPKARRPSSLA